MFLIVDNFEVPETRPLVYGSASAENAATKYLTNCCAS